ncbi:Ig-like domain-containing protein [Bacillus sp. JJ722]|uniref:Ig-like domain-containing protein n=1 Tax=Bacillus sp. JJ722 TaxID=3122973 RepID=UPI002FFD6E36
MKQKKIRAFTSLVLTSILMISTIFNGIGFVAEPIVAKAEDSVEFKLLTDIGPIGNDSDKEISGKLSKPGKVDVISNVVVDGKPVEKSILKDGKAVSTNENGEFTVTIKQQLANTKIVFVFTDRDGNIIKEEATILDKNSPQLDKTPPEIKSVDRIFNTRKTITGTVSEPGSITATLGDKTLGTVSVIETNKIAENEYSFTIILNDFQPYGSVISLQATDLAEPTALKSDMVNLTVESDSTPPTLETPIKEVSDSTTVVEGKVNKPATVQIEIDGKPLDEKPTATDVYGNFNITIPAQVAGTEIKVIITDAANNKLEEKIVVKDRTAPVINKVNDVFETSNYIKGEVSEKSTIIIEKYTDATASWESLGAEIETDEKGVFSYKLTSKLEKDAKIRVTAKDANSNSSKEHELTVKEDKTAPLLSSEMVDIGNKEDTVFEGQLTEEGTVEATVNGKTVLLTSEGVEADRITTDDDGNFKAIVKQQLANTKITFVFTDVKGNTSKRIVTVKDMTEAALVYPKITHTSGIKNSSKIVTGTVNKPGVITVTLGDKVLGKTTIKETAKPDEDSDNPENRKYHFTVTLNSTPAVNDVLTIQATDYTKPEALESDIINVVVTKDEAPPTLTGDFIITDAMTSVAGKMDKAGEVQLFAGSTPLHTKPVNTDAEGNFKVSIKKQVAGTDVTVKMKDLVGNLGEATEKVIDKTAPSVKTVKTVYDTSTALQGNVSETGTITAEVAGVTSTSTIEANGDFTIKLNSYPTKGEKINLFAVDEAGNKGLVKSITVREDKVAPKLITPKTIEVNNTGDVTVEGQLDEQATIDVVDGNGNSVLIGEKITPTANNNFTFKVTVQKQSADTKLIFMFEDMKRPKPNVLKKTVTVKDGIAPVLKVNTSVSSSNRLITGTVSEPSVVTATVNGKSVGSVTVKESNKISDGVYQFNIVLRSFLSENAVVTLQAKDYAKPKRLLSNIVNSKVTKDTVAPYLEGSFIITDAQTYVKGKTNKDAKVQLFVGQTPIHTKAVATDAYGNFRITIKKQPAGTKVRVVTSNPVDSKMKNESRITVKDETPPVIRKVDTVYDTSKVIQGQISEAGTVTAQIDGMKKQTSKTDSNGNFKITLPNRLAKGTKIIVTAKDKAGNVTKSERKITVNEDRSAPRLVEPKTIVIEANKAKVIKGTLSEEGSVEVTYGSSLIKKSTNADGGFTVNIPAQKANTKVNFVFKDVKGNKSTKTVVVRK